MDFAKKRWISLVAGFLIGVASGFGFAFSVAILPLSEEHGWSLSQLSIVFTISSVTMMIAAPTILPFLRARLSISKCILIGAVLFGAGTAIGGLSNNLIIFIFFYSFVSGIGTTLTYPLLLAFSVDAFPDKGGFASGFVASGLAIGSFIWSLVTPRVYAVVGSMSTFIALYGAFVLIVIGALSFLLFNKPDDFAIMRKGSDGKSGVVEKVEVWSYSLKNRKEMVQSKLFFIVFFAVVCICICAQMVVSQVSPIMQLTFGHTAEAAASIVGFYALANFAGRLIWGTISDKIGRSFALLCIVTIMGGAMVTLWLIHVPTIYIVAMLFVGSCYGGTAAILTPLTADIFGSKYITENYGIMYMVYGLAGVIGSPVIAFIKDNTGSYDPAFIIGACFALLGMLLAFMLFRVIAPARKKHLQKSS
jgi:OFA family oxalate/formate antiporter-like MFS transporter